MFPSIRESDDYRGLSEMQSDVELNKSVSLSLAAWSAPFSKAQVDGEEDEGWFNMSGPSSILPEALEGTSEIYLRAQTAKKAEKFTLQLLTPLPVSTIAGSTLKGKKSKREVDNFPARVSWAPTYGVSESMSTMIINRVASLASGPERDNQTKKHKDGKKAGTRTTLGDA